MFLFQNGELLQICLVYLKLGAIRSKDSGCQNNKKPQRAQIEVSLFGTSQVVRTFHLLDLNVDRNFCKEQVNIMSL